MFCKRCGKKISKSSSFCKHCGFEIKINNTDDINDSLEDKDKFQKIRRISPKAVFIALGTILFIGILILLIIFNPFSNPVRKYISLIENSKYSEAQKLYREDILSDRELVLDLEKKINEKLSNIKSEYVSGKITYDDALEKINLYSNCNGSSDYSKIKSEIEELNASQKNYKDALEYEKNNNLEKAIDCYASVISTDDNYNQAQSRIQKLKPEYEKDIYNKIENLIKNDKLSDATDCISKAKKVLGNNNSRITNFENQINKIEKQKSEAAEKAKIDNLKKSQKVIVTSAKAYDDGYSIVFMKGTVTVKNLTNKVVKEVHVGLLQFDNKGYPVDVEYSWEGEDNLLNCRMQSANIEPNRSYGSGTYWDLEDQVKKIKACVKSVKFLDGATWENEYFDYWLKAEKSSY